MLNVGLHHVASMTDRCVFVQLRTKVGDDLFCKVSALVQTLYTDIALQDLRFGNITILPAIMQMCFICSSGTAMRNWQNAIFGAILMMSSITWWKNQMRAKQFKMHH